MDISKAFDCLPHELLIAKLAAYGLDKVSLKLISHYLRGRFQRVKIGTSFSKWVEILLGIPQGSILGPILFNIFINDFLYSLQRTEVCNFADDNTIYSCASSIDAVISDLEVDMTNSLFWFKSNQLVANPSKFKLMFLGIKNKNLGLFIYDDFIFSSTSVKLLGITLDNKLNFDNHINNICTQANRKVSCLFRVRKYLDDKQARQLCNAFVLSNFNYCPLIWMFCSKSLNSKINKVHKRALKAVTREYEKSLDELLSTQSELNIHSRNVRTLLTEVFKIQSGFNPIFLSELFSPKLVPYSLRTSCLVTLPTANTSRYGINSLTFRASQLWNSLPDGIKMCESVQKFKTNLASWDKITCLCPLCST